MPKNTFWDIIERTIEKAGTLLSPKEIWTKANELGTLDGYITTGKTPWATIAAYCYTDITRGGNQSKFIQTSERSAQFFLRRLSKKSDFARLQIQKENEIQNKGRLETKTFSERDRHTILVSYVHADPHLKPMRKLFFMKIHLKTQKARTSGFIPIS